MKCIVINKELNRAMIFGIVRGFADTERVFICENEEVLKLVNEAQKYYNTNIKVKLA